MKSKSLAGFSLRYGAVAGGLSGILAILMYLIGRHPFLIAPYLDFRIMLFGVFLYFSLREFRDSQQGGILFFTQGIFGGFVLILVASVSGALVLYVFSLIVPDFVTEYIEGMRAYLATFDAESIKRIGQAEFDRNLKQLGATNGQQLAVTYFGQGMLIGLVVNIIIAVITRKTPN